MKNFSFNTIYNIVQEPQELHRFNNVPVDLSASLLNKISSIAFRPVSSSFLIYLSLIFKHAIYLFMEVVVHYIIQNIRVCISTS